MDLLVVAALFIILIICLIWFLWRSYTYWHRIGIPYLQPTFPYGNLKGFGHHEQFGLLLDRFYKGLRDHGQIGGVYFLWKPFAVAIDLELIQRILITDFSYFSDRGTYYNERDDPLSAHLFSLDTDKWRPLRRKLTPTFTTGKMKTMFPIMLQLSKQLESYLSDIVADQSSVDLEVFDIIGRFTTDVIGTCAFGIQCNSLANENQQFRRMGRRAFVDRNFSTPIALILSGWVKISRALRLRIINAEVSDFFMNLVREIISYRDKENVQRNDFLSILLDLRNDSNNSMTVSEMAAQVHLFFIAGFDTSATTSTYAMYELAKNQQIQTKLRDEIQKSIEKHDGQLTYESIMEIEYLNQVINETLRHHPPVAQIIRRVTQNYQIPNTTIHLPKGMPILIPVHSIHHDPRYYDEPDRFNPDRFAYNKQQKNGKAFLAFGDGPRNCIGLRFGQMQVRIALCTLLLNYNLSICSKTPQQFEYDKKNVIMVPIDGIHLNLTKL